MARSIGGTQYKLVAKAGYFSRGAAPRSASDLARVNCLRYENTDALSTWQLSGPDGNVKVRVSGNLAVNNSESLRELVLAGLGVAVLPGFVVDGDLRAAAGSTTHAPDARVHRLPRERAAVDILNEQFAGYYLPESLSVTRTNDPAIHAGVLRKILLVRLSRLEESDTEITRLPERRWQDGRLPVDVAVVPAVDLVLILR